MESNKNAIVDYYDLCESDYRMFWDLDRSLAMHAGFWDETTKSLHEALRRENEVLAECVHISSRDEVLDAGCGVGGSSIFLAKQYGCRVTGITLSSKQVETARSHAAKHGVASKATFHVQDFCQTQFPKESFDVVWAVESICHANDKAEFVKEAYRLLKKGGRLIVADGFATEKYLAEEEETSQMEKWLKRWGINTLETVKNFEAHLQTSFFENISFRDMTKHVLPSSRRLYCVSFPAFVFSKLGEKLGMRKKIQTDNIQGAYYQYKTLKQGLWNYGIFYARKPE